MSHPALFDLRECEKHLVELAGPDRGRFTGTTTEKDGELVDAILAAAAAGVPQDHVARLARLSVHTVAGVVERAEKSGKIAPWKERMARLLARSSELLAAQMVDDVSAGKITPAQKGLMTAILIDKALLISGEATSRVEHVQRVRPEDILAEIKRAKIVEIEPAADLN